MTVIIEENVLPIAKKQLRQIHRMLTWVPITAQVLQWACVYFNAHESVSFLNQLGPFWLVVGMLTIGSYGFAWGICWLSLKEDIKGFQLAVQSDQQVFRVTEEGLQLPLTLLYSPAFYRMAERNLSELSLRWEAAHKSTLFSRSAKAKPIFLHLYVTGEAELFTHTLLGSPSRAPNNAIILMLKRLNDSTVNHLLDALSTRNIPVDTIIDPSCYSD